MEMLSVLIKEAMENGEATLAAVCVEVNGGVPIYTLDGAECTATDAAYYLDR